MTIDKYETVKKLNSAEFKRVVGVTKETFNKMLSTYESYHAKKPKLGGPKYKLSPATRILVMLEYYREYRTQIHIAVSYGVKESTISRTIREVEKVLIKSGLFTLPGKKALEKQSLDVEYIVIDATESPIQRPKKNKKNTIVEKRKNIQ